MPRGQVSTTLAHLLAGVSAPLAAQPAPQFAPPASLDAPARREIVATLGQALRDRYVFPETGERAAAAIEAALAAGNYDALSDLAAFSARLTADLANVAHDKHMMVQPMMAGPPSPPPGASIAMPIAEAGVTRADKLAGGIGYIEVIGFPPPQVFKPVLDRAMTALKGSRALIIDDRRNGGGTPAGVAYLVSYLIAPDRPVEINAIVSRTPNTRDFTRAPMRSEPTPISFAGVPVMVLTSHGTFSGGEELAYDIQALKLGTIVGEVTGGGANPVGPVQLGHGMIAAMPFGRAENPVTKTNWEGRGVQPDVPAQASDALAAALERLHQPPIRDIAAASQQQVFAPRTTARPGSEQAIRHLLADIAAGKVDDSFLAPQAAEPLRQNLALVQGILAPLGALRSVRFQHSDAMGGDDFELTFANGNAMMALVVDAEGKVLAIQPPMPLPPTR